MRHDSCRLTAAAVAAEESSCEPPLVPGYGIALTQFSTVLNGSEVRGACLRGRQGAAWVKDSTAQKRIRPLEKGSRHVMISKFRLALLTLLFIAPEIRGQAVPTFVDIPTFMGAPLNKNLDELKADFAVLGAPFDEGTWGWPGERYGPRGLREASQEYSHDLTEGFVYIDGNRTTLKGKKWVDVGNVEVMPTVPAATDDKITDAVHKILSKKTFPIVLGGDHSITFAIVRAFDIPITIVHFDAHLDTWNGAPGNLDHASWVNRVAKLNTVKKIIQVGMRGLANDDESIGNARKLGTHVITGEAVHREGPEKVLSQIQIEATENVYITLDVDVMDPTLTPGTGTLEPDGLNFREIDTLLKGVARKGKLVGFDIVEVNPMRDQSGRTAQTAVRLLVDALSEAFH